MDLPAELFVKPVEGDDDLFAFRFDFEGKAADGQELVTEADNGDLIIEGYAAVFEGDDREGENFVDGAFTRGIKDALTRPSGIPLCFNHRHPSVLGKVLELVEEKGMGLKMRARVDGAIKTHPEMGTYYNQIKNGTLRALSVGGFFQRADTPVGPKIAECDFTEISVVPVPAHAGTNFAVVAGKALEDLKVPRVPKVDGEVRDEDKYMIEEAIRMLDVTFERIKTRGKAKPKPNVTL